MGIRTISGPLIEIKVVTMWRKDLDSPRDKVWHTHGSQEFGDEYGIVM